MASLAPPTPQYPDNKGRSFVGQLIHGIRRITIPFTQQMMDKTSADALVGTAETEITPNDWDSSQVRTYDTSAIGPLLLAEWFAVPGKAPVGQDLPDVLTELSVTYEIGGGVGNYNETVTANATGNLNVSGSANGSAQASSFVMPKIKTAFRPQYRQVLPVTHCYFYAAPPITTASILARLSGPTGLNATVLDWPAFKPVGHTLTLSGRKANVSARKAYQVSYSESEASTTFIQSNGSGTSEDVAPSKDFVQIPPCLHGAFSLTAGVGTIYNATATITVNAGVLGGGGTVTAQAHAEGSVTPSVLSATSPAGLPASGLYLWKVDVDATDEFGYNFVHAVVFDFANA